LQIISYKALLQATAAAAAVVAPGATSYTGDLNVGLATAPSAATLLGAPAVLGSPFMCALGGAVELSFFQTQVRGEGVTALRAAVKGCDLAVQRGCGAAHCLTADATRHAWGWG
jgi:hypothetical protein